MKYAWVLFDADGTLFDFDKAEGLALRTTFEERGLAFEPHTATLFTEINSQTWREFECGQISQTELRHRRFERLFDALAVECDVASFGEQYVNNLARNSDLIDGAEDVIRTLHGKIRMMLITNGLAQVQRRRWAAASIRAYMADIVISEEIGAAKPDARIFDAAFERMGGPLRHEVLIVGDSLTSDIAGGIGYGIDTCWYNPQNRPRPRDTDIRFEIENLSELVDILL